MSLKHISGWVDVSEADHPVGPGWNPVDPGYGRPDIGGGRPGNELPGGSPGHIWGAILRLLGGGQVDNDLPGGGGQVWGALLRLVKWALSHGHVSGGPIKPPGIPIIWPPDPDWGPPPSGPPSWSGGWVPLEPGYGLPPVWGWLPTDPGFGIDVGGRPNNDLPGTPGHWVPVDPNYGIETGGRCPPHASTQPIWVWIAEIGPDFGRPKPTPK